MNITQAEISIMGDVFDRALEDAKKPSTKAPDGYYIDKKYKVLVQGTPPKDHNKHRVNQGMLDRYFFQDLDVYDRDNIAKHFMYEIPEKNVGMASKIKSLINKISKKIREIIDRIKVRIAKMMQSIRKLRNVPDPGKYYTAPNMTAIYNVEIRNIRRSIDKILSFADRQLIKNPNRLDQFEDLLNLSENNIHSAMSKIDSAKNGMLENLHRGPVYNSVSTIAANKKGEVMGINQDDALRTFNRSIVYNTFISSYIMTNGAEIETWLFNTRKTYDRVEKDLNQALAPGTIVGYDVATVMNHFGRVITESLLYIDNLLSLERKPDEQPVVEPEITDYSEEVEDYE